MPLLQIARLILDSRNDAESKTTVCLLFGNRRKEDILTRGEIEDLARSRPSCFFAAYSLTDKRGVPEGWTGHVGCGDLLIIVSLLPPPTGGDGKTIRSFWGRSRWEGGEYKIKYCCH